MRYFLLFKRLLKKKSYILCLALVPVMALILRAMTYLDSGIFTVGIYVPGTDEASTSFIEELQDNPGALQYIFYQNEDTLTRAVATGLVNEGWIFPEDLQQVLDIKATKGSPKEKVHVVIREEGISHMLAREVLEARLYPALARSICLEYVSDSLYDNQATEKTKNQIGHIYDLYSLVDNLFVQGSLQDDVAVTSDDYLTMPLRGILSLWLMLCAFASTMYFLQDKANGLFIWWHAPSSFARDLGYMATFMLLPTFVVELALYYGGSFLGLGRELVMVLLYDSILIFLSLFLGRIFHAVKAIGLLTPVCILTSAIFTPVFMDFKEGRSIQGFFPGFHYLSSSGDNYYLVTMAIYAAVLGIICGLTYLWERIK